MKADLLMLLTDTEGLYTSDPSADSGARLVEEVTDWSLLERDRGRRHRQRHRFRRHEEQDRGRGDGDHGQYRGGHRQRLPART